MKKFIVLILIILAFLASGSFYVLNQTDQALIVEFGNPVAVETKPGVHFKKPFMLQDILFFEKRVLEINSSPKEFITADLKKVIIDSFAKYRIVDPLKFYQTVRNERGIKNAVAPILDSRLREVVGTVQLNTLLSSERLNIMNTARDNVNNDVKNSFGINMIDVRIMRADLPKENSEKIYRRMQTAREREAKEYRAQGAEEAQIIRSTADKDRIILLAEANKKALEIRGQGDAISTKITGDAFNRDKNFYAFYRSMEAYAKTMNSDDTSLVMSPNSEFLRYFNSIGGKLR